MKGKGIHVGAMTSWYGSNRMLAAHVGRELDGCSFVGVVFAGGMTELPHIAARAMLVNDKHRHLINLASVAADPKLGPALYRRLRRVPYHPDALARAQAECLRFERSNADDAELFAEAAPDPLERHPDARLRWAEAYFVVSWMVRHSNAGTPAEFTGGIGMRYDAGGGDNGTHYRNAVKSLVAWRRQVLWRCNFTTFDFREFLDRCCRDEPGHGYYADPPFPGPGDKYTHRIGDKDHRDLAERLAGFERARVVARFYDHPLVRELYPESRWTWVRRPGRKQTNDEAPEVLLINGPSYAQVAA